MYVYCLTIAQIVILVLITFFLCLEETGGSILGSKHLEFTELFAEDGSMKSDKEIKASKYIFTILNFVFYDLR